MNSQQTSPDIIEHEILTVRQVAGLDGSETVTFIDGGWDSRVYSFGDGKFVMKFPRSQKVHSRYPTQITALKLARELSSDLHIPEIIWEHPDHEYFGYRAVNGATLTDALPSLDATAKQHIGKALGNFLKRFHRLELPGARNMEPMQEIKQLQDWYGKGAIDASGLFSNGELQLLQKQVNNSWPSQLSALNADIRLCHGDLHFSNIFYNQAGEVGLIDFGDICYADYSKDFSDFDDQEILAQALQAYGDTSVSLHAKIELRQSMLRVITLTANLIKHDEAKAQQTAGEIRKRLI